MMHNPLIHPLASMPPGLGIEITLKKTLPQAAVHKIDEPGELLKSAAVCWRC